MPHAADGHLRESRSIVPRQCAVGSCVTVQLSLYRWGLNREVPARFVSIRNALTNSGFAGCTEGQAPWFPDREQKWLWPCSDYSSGMTSRGFQDHRYHRGEYVRRASPDSSHVVRSDNTHTGSRLADEHGGPSPPRTTHSLVGFNVSRLTQ